MRLAVLILAAVVALAGTAFAAVVLLTRRARRRRDADAQTRAEDRGRVRRRLDDLWPGQTTRPADTAS